MKRFSAFVGSKTKRTPALVLDSAQYTDYAFGCAMSHFALWQECATGAETFTIAEDDAVFHSGFVESAAEAEFEIGTYDLILWGWNFDAPVVFEVLDGISPCVATFSQKRLRENWESYAKKNIGFTWFRLQRAFGSCAYSISPRGARKFIDHCLPIRPMGFDCPGVYGPVVNGGIDVMMNVLYPSVRAYVCFPPLAITCNYRNAEFYTDLAVA